MIQDRSFGFGTRVAGAQALFQPVAWGKAQNKRAPRLADVLQKTLKALLPRFGGGVHTACTNALGVLFRRTILSTAAKDLPDLLQRFADERGRKEKLFFMVSIQESYDTRHPSSRESLSTASLSPSVVPVSTPSKLKAAQPTSSRQIRKR